MFRYNSPFWTNKKTWNVYEGLDGLTQNEVKLASYHNTPFTKLCLGMTPNHVINWILVDYTATSLYSVIADRKYRKTNVGREKWMSLINGASLQHHCNMEGFNVQCSRSERKARIGILGNTDQDDCESCDSVIGFGIKISNWKGSSGNIQVWNINTGNLKILKTFGYIFVQ